MSRGLLPALLVVLTLGHARMVAAETDLESVKDLILEHCSEAQSKFYLLSDLDVTDLLQYFGRVLEMDEKLPTAGGLQSRNFTAAPGLSVTHSIGNSLPLLPLDSITSMAGVGYSHDLRPHDPERIVEAKRCVAESLETFGARAWPLVITLLRQADENSVGSHAAEVMKRAAWNVAVASCNVSSRLSPPDATLAALQEYLRTKPDGIGLAILSECHGLSAELIFGAWKNQPVKELQQALSWLPLDSEPRLREMLQLLATRSQDPEVVMSMWNRGTWSIAQIQNVYSAALVDEFGGLREDILSLYPALIESTPAALRTARREALLAGIVTVYRQLPRQAVTPLIVALQRERLDLGPLVSAEVRLLPPEKLSPIPGWDLLVSLPTESIKSLREIAIDVTQTSIDREIAVRSLGGRFAPSPGLLGSGLLGAGILVHRDRAEARQALLAIYALYGGKRSDTKDSAVVYSQRLLQATLKAMVELAGEPLPESYAGGLVDLCKGPTAEFAAQLLSRMGADILPSILKGLSSEDSEQKRTLLQLVKDLAGNDRAVLPFLATLIGDEDSSVRTTALQLIGGRGGLIRGPLERQLGREFLPGRMLAAQALIEAGLISPEIKTVYRDGLRQAGCEERLRLLARIPVALRQAEIMQPALTRLVVECLGVDQTRSALPLVVDAGGVLPADYDMVLKRLLTWSRKEGTVALLPELLEGLKIPMSRLHTLLTDELQKNPSSSWDDVTLQKSLGIFPTLRPRYVEIANGRPFTTRARAIAVAALLSDDPSSLNLVDAIRSVFHLHSAEESTTTDADDREGILWQFIRILPEASITSLVDEILTKPEGINRKQMLYSLSSRLLPRDAMIRRLRGYAESNIHALGCVSLRALWYLQPSAFAANARFYGNGQCFQTATASDEVTGQASAPSWAPSGSLGWMNRPPASPLLQSSLNAAHPSATLTPDQCGRSLTGLLLERLRDSDCLFLLTQDSAPDVLAPWLLTLRGRPQSVFETTLAEKWLASQ